ncbi:MAG: nucleotidyltransferase [Bacteroidota bacterium]
MNSNGKLIHFAEAYLTVGQKETEREHIERTLAHFEEVLRGQLGSTLLDIRLFGSYTRNTVLPRQYDPQSDVDILVVWDWQNKPEKPGNLRKRLLDILENAYPDALSQSDFPAVKLTFKHIKFDLVPALPIASHWANPQYHIPGPNDSWIVTTPTILKADLDYALSDSPNHPVLNVIRLMKYWNGTQGYPLPSYYLEEQVISTFHKQNVIEGLVYALSHVYYWYQCIPYNLWDATVQQQLGALLLDKPPKQGDEAIWTWLVEHLPALSEVED